MSSSILPVPTLWVRPSLAPPPRARMGRVPPIPRRSVRCAAPACRTGRLCPRIPPFQVGGTPPLARPSLAGNIRRGDRWADPGEARNRNPPVCVGLAARVERLRTFDAQDGTKGARLLGLARVAHLPNGGRRLDATSEGGGGRHPDSGLWSPRNPEPRDGGGPVARSVRRTVSKKRRRFTLTVVVSGRMVESPKTPRALYCHTSMKVSPLEPTMIE